MTLSELFAPIRRYLQDSARGPGLTLFGKLLSCPMCLSFWTGLIGSTWFSPAKVCFPPPFATTGSLAQAGNTLLPLLVDGFLASGVSLVLHYLVVMAAVLSNGAARKSE